MEHQVFFNKYNQGILASRFFGLKAKARNYTSLRGAAAASRALNFMMVCAVAGLLSFDVSAYTLTWPSSDDPTWEYTVTLSNHIIKKVGSAHEGSTPQVGARPGRALNCTKGLSGLFPGALYVWCDLIAGGSGISMSNETPYAHWFYVEQPLPVEPYWFGSHFAVTGGGNDRFYFGPGFKPGYEQITSKNAMLDTDFLSYARTFNRTNTWVGHEVWVISYLSLKFIEADMFGKKFRSQSTLRQRVHMTDPVMVSEGCCDTGIYEMSFDYDITLKRLPLEITLPSHVDMGELTVGNNSESKRIDFSLSANSKPVSITAGSANLSFEQVKGLSSSAGCSASVQVSNELGPINRGELVDLHSFYGGTDYGIKAQIVNTDGCVAGDHEEVLSFTVAWQ